MVKNSKKPLNSKEIVCTILNLAIYLQNGSSLWFATISKLSVIKAIQSYNLGIFPGNIVL